MAFVMSELADSYPGAGIEFLATKIRGGFRSPLERRLRLSEGWMSTIDVEEDRETNRWPLDSLRVVERRGIYVDIEMSVCGCWTPSTLSLALDSSESASALQLALLHLTNAKLTTRSIKERYLSGEYM